MRTNSSRWTVRRYGVVERPHPIAFESGDCPHDPRHENGRRGELDRSLMQGGVDQPNHRTVISMIECHRFRVIGRLVMTGDVLMDLHDVMVHVFVSVRRRNRLPEGQADRKQHGSEGADRWHGSAIMAVVSGGRQRNSRATS